MNLRETLLCHYPERTPTRRSPYTCLQIQSVSVFEKTKISCVLQQPLSQSNLTCRSNQLILFDIKPDTSVTGYLFPRGNHARRFFLAEAGWVSAA